MPSILAQDARVLPSDWSGPLNAWRKRLALPVGAPIDPDLDGALQALPVQIRSLNGPWIKALQADPALPLPYTVGLGYSTRPGPSFAASRTSPAPR